MNIEKILKQYPNQVESGRCFIIEIGLCTDKKTYYFRVAQQVRPKVKIKLNGLKPLIKLGYHFGISKKKIEELGIELGYVFDEKYNLKVFNSYSPQYPKQQFKKTAAGEVVLSDGKPIYEHIIFDIQPLSVNLWKTNIEASEDLEMSDSVISSLPFGIESLPQDEF